jgi:type II secretory pathway pseudopilin PulG
MTHRTNRSAATLIELLVVIGIMVVLMGLAAMILPSLRTSNNAAKAASVVSGQLSIAKQRALRDQSPRGIRLVQDLVNDPSGMTVREIQFIEQPTAVVPTGVGVSVLLAGTAPGPFTVQLQGTTQTWDGYGVENGDTFLLTVSNVTYAYRIVAAPSGFNLTVMPLSAPSVFAPIGIYTDGFRVIRKPRALVGEPNFQLPPKMLIDLSKCSTQPVPSTPANGNPVLGWNTFSEPLDIMFNPGGELVNCPIGKVILYVRSDESTDVTEDTLVCIYATTGNIILHEVSPAGPTPYEYTRDGKGSGL